MALRNSIPFVCLLMLFYFYKASAQPQPDLTCVSVISTNSVEVVWDVPTGSFDGFRLFYKESGAPAFTSQDYPSSSTSAVINTPNVTTTKYEFFLVTYVNTPAGISGESNHLETMRLVISGAETGIARLSWNRQSTQDQTYRVMRSEDNINYTLLTTISSPEYNDTITGYCDTTLLYYRIEAGLCNAKSTVADAGLFDATPPENPSIQLVTVNNGLAEVTWEASRSSDVIAYIIERGTPSQGFFFYREVGNVTSFIDNFIGDPDFLSACDNVVTYIVRAKDQCGQGSAGDYVKLHNTILITGNTEELCDRKATLYWNNYKNMLPPVTHYKVEKSVNGQPFIDIEDIAVTSGSYEYIDPELLEPGIEVRYRIAAVNENNSLVSHSCELSLIPAPPLITSFDISNVTVTDNTYITLTATSDPVEIPHDIAIFRVSGSGKTLIGTQPWDPTGGFKFEDHEVSVSTSSYQYIAEALDSCGFSISQSDIFNSILLSIGITDEVNVNLDWTNQIGWNSDLENYRVYKFEEGVLLPGYPVIISPTITSYNETDTETDALRTSYVVEAVHTNGTASRSNEVLLPRDAKIDVPTAFRPSGVNKTFRPLMKNIDQARYFFRVFNRWGQQVFQTKDPFTGWDGYYNGKIQQGVYVYEVSYVNQAGTSGIKRGTVILLD